MHTARHTEELSGIVKRHAEAVRKLPGLAAAEAVIIVESNMGMVADGVKADLSATGRHPLANATFLDMDPVKRNVSVDGWLNPGIRTTDRTKEEMMERMKRMLERNRIHWHAQLVAYATPDREREERMLGEVGGDLQALWARYVQPLSGGALATMGAHDVFVAEARARVTSLMVREMNNMVRIARPAGVGAAAGASAQQRQQLQNADAVKYKYTGKVGPGGTDDCVMALGIGIVGLAHHQAMVRAAELALQGGRSHGHGRF